MKVKALVSFAGAVSMAFKEVRDIEDKDICEDLLRAGYVEPVEAEEQDENKVNVEGISPVEKKDTPNPEEGEVVPPQDEEKPVVKSKKKVKADEDQ